MTEEIKKILLAAAESIKAKMQAEGINASGRTAASLRVEEYEDGIRLVMGGENTAPVPTLEVGRQGGRVPAGFRFIIEQWAREKGLNFGSERDLHTFAYFTANKIAREGTQRRKQNVDVYSSIVREAAESVKMLSINKLRKDVVTMTKLHF